MLAGQSEQIGGYEWDETTRDISRRLPSELTASHGGNDRGELLQISKEEMFNRARLTADGADFGKCKDNALKEQVHRFDTGVLHLRALPITLSFCPRAATRG
jgi:hypothetical protein